MADSELAELDELKARAFEVSQKAQCSVSTSPPSSSLLDWGDDQLLDDSLGKKLYDITDQREYYRHILYRFWYFYLTGLIQEDFTIFEILVDPLIIFFEIDNKVHGYKTIWAKTDLTDVVEEVIYVPKLEKFGPFAKWDYIESSTNLYDFITTKIKAIYPNKACSREEILLRRFTAYISLTLFRGLIKGKTELQNSFLDTQYKKNIALLIGEEYSVKYDPPCTLCIENALTGLSIAASKAKQVFARLVGNYVRRQREGKATANTVSVFEASVLNDTAGYGIEMMFILPSATRHLKCGWFDIFNATNTLQLKQGWQRIIDFQERYCQEGKIQYGYPWARIINDGFLKEYSPKENLEICAMLAGIYSDDDDEIWREEWIKNRRHEVASWIVTGRAAARQIIGVKDDIEGDANANANIKSTEKSEPSTQTYKAVVQSEGSVYADKAKAIKFLMTTQDATKNDEHLVFWENNFDEVEELLGTHSSKACELLLRGLKIGPEYAALVLAAFSEGQTIQRQLSDENTMSELKKVLETEKTYCKQLVAKTTPGGEVTKLSAEASGGTTNYRHLRKI